jgi:hypothetical protein
VDLLGRLCDSLSRDETLREVLSDAGISAEQWHTLDTAVTTGAHSPPVGELVEQIITVAEDQGVDIAGRNREYRPLPAGTTGILSVWGWVCPHRRRCDRTDFTARSPAPVCGVTGTPLRAAEGTSG